MFRLPSEKEEHKDTIGALILSIFIIIAGIGGMIYTKHESSEFKNSTDVRTLHATPSFHTYSLLPSFSSR